MGFTEVFVNITLPCLAGKSLSLTQKTTDQTGLKMFTVPFPLPHFWCKLKYYTKKDSVLFTMKPLEMDLGTTKLTTIIL